MERVIEVCRQISWRRVSLVGAVTIFAALLSLRAHSSVYDGRRSDFSQIYAAAGAWMAGSDPYEFVGPGRAFDSLFPLLYPFTAVLFAVPFTRLPAPDALFAGFGAGLFAWAVSGRPQFRFAWLAVFAPAFIYTVQMSQWSALMIGSALVPAWGFVLACKPTIGTALWLAYPSRRALLGSTAFLILSVALLPSWPLSWVHAFPAATHMRAPATFWGGPLLLLALTRWRRPEARLLAALSCLPQTTELYESLALFLVPSTIRQSALLLVLNYGVVLALVSSPLPVDYVADKALTGQWMVILLYLPCLVMVLRRPNAWGDGPQWSGISGEKREPRCQHEPGTG